MSIRYLILLLFLVGIQLSCTKENKRVIVIKDCTGIYVQMDGKDYKVINEAKLSNFNNGQHINAQFHEEWVECPTSGTTCLMLHDFEYYVFIDKIIF